MGRTLITWPQASSVPADRQPSTTASVPSALTLMAGMTGAIASSSAPTASAKPGARPMPPPRTIRSGSTTVMMAQIVLATSRASSATTAIARPSPAAAASNTKGKIGEDDLTGLAPLLLRAAEAGDGVARTVVSRPADEISVMAITAMRRLGLTGLATPVVLGGGVITARNPQLMSGITALLGLDHVHAPAAESRLRAAYEIR